MDRQYPKGIPAGSRAYALTTPAHNKTWLQPIFWVRANLSVFGLRTRLLPVTPRPWRQSISCLKGSLPPIPCQLGESSHYRQDPVCLTAFSMDCANRRFFRPGQTGTLQMLPNLPITGFFVSTRAVHSNMIPFGIHVITSQSAVGQHQYC